MEVKWGTDIFEKLSNPQKQKVTEILLLHFGESVRGGIYTDGVAFVRCQASPLDPFKMYNINPDGTPFD